MRLVVATDPGTVEINYTWLPTWIGLNQQLINRMAERIRPMAVDRPLDDPTLALLEVTLIQLLEDEFPYIEGLGDTLRSIHGISIGEPGRQ